MFETGEYIVHGVGGICRVAEVGPSPYDKADTQVYYLLIPVQNASRSTIYTPVQNDRVLMRRLMTGEEIDALIGRMPQIAPLAVPAEKHRREIYRTVLGTLKPDGYVQIIKTVEQRRILLTAARRRVPMIDLEYGRMARHLLCSECAQVLGITEREAEQHMLAALVG